MSTVYQILTEQVSEDGKVITNEKWIEAPNMYSLVQCIMPELLNDFFGNVISIREIGTIVQKAKNVLPSEDEDE